MEVCLPVFVRNCVLCDEENILGIKSLTCLNVV